MNIIIASNMPKILDRSRVLLPYCVENMKMRFKYHCIKYTIPGTFEEIIARTSIYQPLEPTHVLTVSNPWKYVAFI